MLGEETRSPPVLWYSLRLSTLFSNTLGVTNRPSQTHKNSRQYYSSAYFKAYTKTTQQLYYNGQSLDNNNNIY